MTFEIRIKGFARPDEALAMQEPVARVLCPVADHDGPCEIPWGFSLDADDLLLGVYATAERSAALVDELRQVVGRHQITVAEATPGLFDELAQQYRIEHPVN